MQHKVLFLDDGSATAKRLKRSVAAAGHTVLEATNEESLRSFLGEGAQVVIHVPSNPLRFSGVLAKLETETFGFPVIHVIEEANFQPSEWLKGPYTEWLPINCTVEALLRKINCLIHFAKLEREFAQVRDNSRRLENFSREIHSTETLPTITRAMDFLREEFIAENVLWFQDDQLVQEIERHVKSRSVIPLHPETRVRPNWLAVNGFETDRLRDVMEKWCVLTASRGALNSGPYEVAHGSAGEVDVIIPVMPFKCDINSRPYGHLVFLGARGWDQLKDSTLCTSYFDLLSQELSSTLAYDKLKATTFRDDLTDLYNQRYLPVVLQQEVERATRSEKPFSVLFLDVDYFKMVNDTKGHMVGSKVLVELSQVFSTAIRRTDFAFRYGGDEYVIVLSGAGAQDAAMVAERLRKKTAETTFRINGDDVRITVSIGIATFPEHAQTTEQLLTMADEAMYFGKHKSRNVVSVAS